MDRDLDDVDLDRLLTGRIRKGYRCPRMPREDGGPRVARERLSGPPLLSPGAPFRGTISP
jgi:hypothetical protein